MSKDLNLTLAPMIRLAKEELRSALPDLMGQDQLLVNVEVFVKTGGNKLYVVHKDEAMAKVTVPIRITKS